MIRSQHQQQQPPSAMSSSTVMISQAITIILLFVTISSFLVSPVRTFDVQDSPPSPRIVNTKYGQLRGVIIPMTSASASASRPSSPFSSLPSVEAFFGVPYASPPTTTLRFMPPVTPTYWRGVRLANRFGPVCPQKLPDISNSTEALRRMSATRLEHLRRVVAYLRNQSEDCLYLNVYVPYHQTPTAGSGSPTTRSNKYPVLVFVNGDSYDWDSGNQFDGSVLASFGQVMVVTLNYRLGVLGFLPAMVDGTVRGNHGLMDQVAALHWIQENANEFGADGHNITIIGHSFGAACVHLLMMSPMAKGLFSRVVLMSGSALSPWAMARDADTYARHLAKAINCPNYDNVVMVDCLRKKSIDELLRVDLPAPKYLSTFGPIVDGIVIPAEPRILMQAGGFDPNYHSTGPSMTNSNWPVDYDILFGATRVEAPFIYSDHEEKNGIDLARRDRILRTLVRNLFDYHQQAILLTLINEYTDWSRPREHPINYLDSTIDILGDALVVAPLMDTVEHFAKWIQYHQASAPNAKTSRGKAFVYVFVYQNEDGTKPHQRLGCQHGEELAYLFGAPVASYFFGRSIGHFASNYSKSEANLAEAVMTYWINFAKFGDPSATFHQEAQDHKKGRFENVVWPPYDLQQEKYLMIGLKPKVRDHYHSHRLSFWLKLIPGLHQPAQDEELYLRHHLLSDHDNAASYDGVVRQIALKFLQPLPTVASPRPKTKQTQSVTSSKSSSSSSEVNPNQLDDVFKANGNSIGGISVVNDDNDPVNRTLATAIVMSSQSDSYTTALSVTIAIGCSLLVLNMLIFAGVYYQLDRAKKRDAGTTASASTGHCPQDLSMSSGPGHAHHHHHLHSYELQSQEEPLMISSLTPATVHYKRSSPSSSSTPSPIGHSMANQTKPSHVEIHSHNNNTASLGRRSGCHLVAQATGYQHLGSQTIGRISAGHHLDTVPEQTALVQLSTVPNNSQCKSPYHQQTVDHRQMNHVGSEINI